MKAIVIIALISIPGAYFLEKCMMDFLELLFPKASKCMIHLLCYLLCFSELLLCMLN